MAAQRMSFAVFLIATALLVGCGSYGGGGGSSSSSAPVGGSASMAATLAWEEASGPVDFYRVVVLRNDEPPTAHSDVTTNQVTVEGVEGDRVRIVVAALDDQGNGGPASEPSPEILFTANGPVATGAAVLDEQATAAAVATLGDGLSGSTTLASSGSTSTSTTPTSSSDLDTTPDATTEPDPNADAELAETRLSDGAEPLLWEADAPSLEMRLSSLWDDTLRTELHFERPGADWWVAAQGDVDGDGRDDLIWETEAGQLAYTSLTALIESAPVAPLLLIGSLGPDETLVGSGDFDGNGHDDLLVEDGAAGTQRVVWLDASGALGDEALATLGDGPVAAIGDFDGDGRDDLARNGAEGGLVLHFLAGANVDARLDLGTGAGEALATGDVDGDGDDDLLVRDDHGTGLLAMEARTGAVHVELAGNHDWQVAGLGDFDADGRADVLWVSASGWLIGFDGQGSEPDYLPVEPGASWAYVGS